MGVSDLYRDRASLGHLPVLKGQTFIELPYRLQPDANTVGLWQGPCGEDLSPNAVVVAANTAARNADGPWASGVTFASGNEIDFGNSSDVTTGSFTCEIVLNCYGMDLTGSNWGMCLVGRGGFAAYGWNVGLGDTSWGGTGFLGKVLCRLRTSGNTEQSALGTTNLTTLGNCYIAMVINRSDATLRIYVNGTQEAVTTSIGAGSLTVATTLIAGHYSTMTPYCGKIFAIRTSNIARSAAELLANAKLMGFA